MAQMISITLEAQPVHPQGQNYHRFTKTLSSAESEIHGIVSSSENTTPQGVPAMQLSFLDKSYAASSNAIEAAPTGEMATFISRPYARQQANIEHRQQPAELTYRGIRYVR